MAVNQRQLAEARESWEQTAQEKRVLITGGPTCEDIDPVRFITNRSTGRMGIALAQAALELGLSPVLVLGPGTAHAPEDIRRVEVRSAADMLAAVLALFPLCRMLVMSAAVADYTPAEPLEIKLKKGEGDLFLRLKRTADILLEISRQPERAGRLVAGFSLDTGINAAEGLRKLEQKGLDLIAVNGTSAFAGENSRILLLGRGGLREELAEQSKLDTARHILTRLQETIPQQ